MNREIVERAAVPATEIIGVLRQIDGLNASARRKYLDLRKALAGLVSDAIWIELDAAKDRVGTQQGQDS